MYITTGHPFDIFCRVIEVMSPDVMAHSHDARVAEVIGNVAQEEHQGAVRLHNML